MLGVETGTMASDRDKYMREDIVRYNEVSTGKERTHFIRFNRPRRDSMAMLE
jgi:hypothetical protein